MKGILAAALTGLLGLSPTSSTAETVIVDQDGLASIYTRIQDGIDAVSDGGEVLVMASLSSTVTFRGTGNRDLDFHGKNITLRGVYGKQNTFIDCEGAARAFNLSAGTDSTSLIEGFTIQNGYADDAGGAIESEGGVPRISDCVFRGNTAAFGGAIRLTQGFTRFTGCRFYGNSATEYGGAVYAAGAGLVLEGCSFSDNDSSDGGALFHIAGDLMTLMPFNPLYPVPMKPVSLKLFRSDNRLVNGALYYAGIAALAYYVAFVYLGLQPQRLLP